LEPVRRRQRRDLLGLFWPNRFLCLIRPFAGLLSIAGPWPFVGLLSIIWPAVGLFPQAFDFFDVDSPNIFARMIDFASRPIASSSRRNLFLLLADPIIGFVWAFLADGRGLWPQILPAAKLIVGSDRTTLVTHV
jgi:hypothetical protein